LREESVAALHGVDIIIHAGNIGNAQIIEHLNEIALVKAIRENVDKGVQADSFPGILTIEILWQ